MSHMVKGSTLTSTVLSYVNSRNHGKAENLPSHLTVPPQPHKGKTCMHHNYVNDKIGGPLWELREKYMNKCQENSTEEN